MGKKHIRQVLQMDPDCVKYQKYWKLLAKQEKLKTEAAEAFQMGQVDEALKIYDECLELDPLFQQYNTTIEYNKACGLARVGQNEAALSMLSKVL